MLRKMYFKMPPCQQLGDLIQRVDTAQGVLFATAMRQHDVAGHILAPRYTIQYTSSVEKRMLHNHLKREAITENLCELPRDFNQTPADWKCY